MKISLLPIVLLAFSSTLFGAKSAKEQERRMQLQQAFRVHTGQDFLSEHSAPLGSGGSGKKTSASSSASSSPTESNMVKFMRMLGIRSSGAK